jgi:hypothetical protein
MSSFLSRFDLSTDIHGLAGDVPRFENISGKPEHFEEKEKLGQQSITIKNLVDFFSQSVLNPEISSAPLFGATASLKVNWKLADEADKD